MNAKQVMDARTILEEVYVEYLACSVGAVTATELARLSGGQLSHDQITRALAGPAHGARELWAKVKGLCIAGNVICRQRPGTARGFVFISLENETGITNAIVTPICSSDCA